MKLLEFFATNIAAAGYQHLSLALLGLKIQQLQAVIGFGPE